MSTQSRSAILARIRAANRSSTDTDRASERQREWNALPRHYRTAGTLTASERLKLFDERIRHYNGTPFYSSGNLQTDIAAILSDRGKRTLIVPPGLPDDWLPEGFRFIRDENLSKLELDAADGVVTGCTLGIALTGTVVLETSSTQGRRAATLIPDYHLCILRKLDIVELVPEAIRRLEIIGGAKGADARRQTVKQLPGSLEGALDTATVLRESLATGPLTFFSGPSATVDIEMTRVRGVHGPRTLDILLI